MDLTPQFMAAADRVLIRLYLHGYIITQGDYNDAEECNQMNTQIFGFTPNQPAGDAYVKYCMAFVNEDGDLVIHVRNARGVVNEVILPRAEGAKLAASLTEHTKPETTI